MSRRSRASGISVRGRRARAARLRLRALLVLVVAGCLSDPPPAGGGDGGPGAIDAASQPDGRPAAACDPTGAPGDPLPHTTSMTFWPGWVGDLNCDEVDDLILMARALEPDEEAQQGLYVVLGRTAGFGAGFDAFVPTGSQRPHALVVEDLGGDARLDLVVYTARDDGGDPVMTESVHLIAFTGQPGLAFRREGEHTVTSVAVPPSFGAGSAAFAFLAGANLDDDGDRDLILSSGGSVVLFELAAWAAPEPIAQEVDFDPGPTWFGPAIAVYPRGDGSGDDVVFANQYSVLHCRHASDGFGLTCRPQTVVPDSASISGLFQHGVFLDLFDDGVPDVVGAGGVVTAGGSGSVGAGAVLVDVAEARALEWTAGGSARLDPTVQRVSWSLVGNYRGQAAPDLLILDNGSPEGRVTRLIAYTDLAIDDDTIGTEEPLRCHVFGGEQTADARTLVEGDFDGDGALELRAFTIDAYHTAVDPAAPLDACADLTARGGPGPPPP